MAKDVSHWMLFNRLAIGFLCLGVGMQHSVVIYQNLSKEALAIDAPHISKEIYSSRRNYPFIAYYTVSPFISPDRQFVIRLHSWIQFILNLFLKRDHSLIRFLFNDFLLLFQLFQSSFFSFAGTKIAENWMAKLSNDRTIVFE